MDEAADRVDILMPHGINLLILDHAPPGLARRIALGNASK